MRLPLTTRMREILIETARAKGCQRTGWYLPARKADHPRSPRMVSRHDDGRILVQRDRPARRV